MRYGESYILVFACAVLNIAFDPDFDRVVVVTIVASAVVAAAAAAAASTIDGIDTLKRAVAATLLSLFCGHNCNL